MKRKNTSQILKSLGARTTQTRVALFDILSSATKPLSVADMRILLSKKGRDVNKTTVYREIQFLLGKDVISPVYIDDTQTKYEFKTDHHHHLVCKNCSTVAEIDLKEIEKVFPLLEKKLKQKMKFSEIAHTLEFFGTCQKCS